MNLTITIKKETDVMTTKLTKIPETEIKSVISNVFKLVDAGESAAINFEIDGEDLATTITGFKETPNIEHIKLVNDNQAKNEPEHWKTGIMYKGETPHYRAHYKCECGNKGKRYILKDSVDLPCHSCGQPINVRPATKKTGKDGLPERDSFGNFYIADNNL